MWSCRQSRVAGDAMEVSTGGSNCKLAVSPDEHTKLPRYLYGV